MERMLTSSALGTVPVVVFHRLDVVNKTRISTHVIVFETASAAREKASQISENPDLELIALVDAVIGQPATQ